MKPKLLFYEQLTINTIHIFSKYNDYHIDKIPYPEEYNVIIPMERK